MGAGGCTAVRGKGHDRASYHRPWWPLALLVRSFPLRCVLISFGASSWAANFANSGSFWASFASLIDLLVPQGSFFLQLLGLTHMNLQSKPKQAKISVIGENRDTNHINIYLNPLKWILNPQLILCKYGSDQTPPCLNFCLFSSKTLDTSN